MNIKYIKKDPGSLVLGIESSCDETAAAVVAEGHIILSSIVASQIKNHAPFGGIVPELASRNHLKNMVLVIRRALNQAKIKIQNISGIAVTQGPGLVGSLVIGLNLAKALAWSQSIPITGINHLEGHLAALGLNRNKLSYPYIALLVSGGHTNLYLVNAPGIQKEIGHTVDDAAGEAYDKIAKLYGLGYPGGPIIDRLASIGRPKFIKLPRPCLYDGTYNFSFSGLKTAVINFRTKHKGQRYSIEDLCLGFQEAIIEVLVKKTLSAAQHFSIKHLAITGGVAANRGLRQAITQAAATANLEITLPPPDLCTDNAAMIAAAGCIRLRSGLYLPNNADIISRYEYF